MTVNGPFKRQPCVAARIMICLEFCAGSRQTLACTTSIIYVAGFPITDSSKCCKTSPSFWPSAASHCFKAFVACASYFGTKVCVASFLFVSLSTLASAIFGLQPADDARGQRHRKPDRRRHFNRSAYRAEVLSGVHRHACDAVANLGELKLTTLVFGKNTFRSTRRGAISYGTCSEEKKRNKERQFVQSFSASLRNRSLAKHGIAPQACLFEGSIQSKGKGFFGGPAVLVIS